MVTNVVTNVVCCFFVRYGCGMSGVAMDGTLNPSTVAMTFCKLVRDIHQQVLEVAASHLAHWFFVKCRCASSGVAVDLMF